MPCRIDDDFYKRLISTIWCDEDLSVSGKISMLRGVFFGLMCYEHCEKCYELEFLIDILLNK